ncbi:hypothetical protein GCM10010145_31720 [Streptomyces ruber]|uniref:Secreted protein n=2 Tax=Streptomyces TaxID=1883 RepID=A0A918ER53_9ACTN|nr:DUF6479 family protein [Streptomyces ruber]GGQ59432.1 hypothetical protein GCM10010145_31720 [Streptomyces ruber]
MNTSHYVAAWASSGLGVGAIVVGGIIVAGLLVWAVRLGINVKRREPRRPLPQEQPTRPPSSGPIGETQEVREPNEMPGTGTGRLTAHDLNTTGSKPSESQQRPRWDSGSSGSFGSGGTGGA